MTRPYLPQFRCYVGFDADPDDAYSSGDYVEVTSYVKIGEGVQWRRGRPSEFDDFPPGSLSLTLKNGDRRFDPRHTTGPYYGKLTPGKPIYITATYSATEVWQFNGFIESWPQQYAEGNKYITVPIQAFDRLTRLNESTVPEQVSNYVLGTVGSCALHLRNCDGTTWFDASGNGRNATRVNDVTRAPTSVGGSMTIGMTSTSVSGGKFTLPDVALGTTYTIAFWLTSGTVTTNNGPGLSVPLINEDAAFVLDPYVQLATDTINGIASAYDMDVTFTAAGGAGSNGGGTTDIEGINPCDGSPHHIVFTANGLTGKTYYDGTLLGTTTGFGTAPSGVVSNINMDEWITSTVFPYSPGLVAPPTSRTALQEPMLFTKTLSDSEVSNLYKISAGKYEESTGTRALRIMNMIGSGISVTSGTYGTVLDLAISGRSALDCLNEVAATEQGGGVFINRSGTLIIRGRYDANDASVAVTFTDSGVGKRYTGVGTDFSRREVWNDVTVTASGGHTGSAQDGTSIAAYGRRSKTVNTLLPSAALAKDMADGLLAIRKDPLTRNTEPLRVALRPGEESFILSLLQLDVGSKVTLKHTPGRVGTQLSTNMIVEGIAWSASEEFWDLALDLAPMPTVGGVASFLKLGDATLGVLGVNRLGY